MSRPGAVGVPLPDVEVRIVELDGTRELAPNEDGELFMRAPQSMLIYWGRPAESGPRSSTMAGSTQETSLGSTL